MFSRFLKISSIASAASSAASSIFSNCELSKNVPSISIHLSSASFSISIVFPSITIVISKEEIKAIPFSSTLKFT